MKATIEIVMATYNGGQFLAEQLESIANQTNSDWHLLVRDDGSTDSTLDVIDRYAKLLPGRITVVSGEPGKNNPCANFAALLEHTSCPYVMFCDQDDVWLENKIDVTLARMREVENRGQGSKPILIHTDLRVVDEQLNLLGEFYWSYQNLSPRQTSLNRLLVQNVPTGCTIMINRTLARLCLPIAPAAVMHDHWISLVASAFGVIDYVDEATVLYRQHSGNRIGASRWWLRVWAMLCLGLGYYRRRVRENILQARAFLEQYSSTLSEADGKTVRALAAMQEKNAFRKRLDIVRHRLFKRGIIRNLAQILAI